MSKFISKPIMIVAATTIVASSLGLLSLQSKNREPLLEVFVFDVSSGRSIFIRTPNDRRILIDGGSNSDVIRELTKILPFYSRRIDLVIATDSLGKNSSGLVDVIERYKVDEVHIPAFTLQTLNLASSSDQIYETLLHTLDRNNIRIKEIKKGDIMFEDDDFSIKAVFPTAPDIFKYSKASAPEILFSMCYGETSFIFMGNASNKIQKFIVSSTDYLHNVDVMVVSHSALPTNISQAFVEKMNPKNLIYSKTINKSSSNISKTKQTKDPLSYIGNSRRFNIKTVGTLKIVSDGKTLYFESEKSNTI